MSKDAGIPFRNLRMDHVQEILGAIRAGEGTEGAHRRAAAIGIRPADVDAFLARNPDAVCRARIDRAEGETA